MNFKKLIKLAADTGGIVVMDDEKPQAVILPIDKYRRLEDRSSNSSQTVAEIEQSEFDVGIVTETAFKSASSNQRQSEDDDKILDELNKEIELLQEEAKKLQQKFSKLAESD